MGAVQLCLLTALGGFSYIQMNKIADELFDIAEEDIPLTQMVTTLTEHQLEQAIYFERVIIATVLVNQNVKTQSDLRAAIEKLKQYKTKTSQEIAQVVSFIEEAIPKLHTEKSIEEFKKLIIKMESISADYSALSEAVDKIIALAESGNIESILQAYEAVEHLEDSMDAKLVKILADIQSFTLRSAVAVEEHEQEAIQWISIIWIVSLMTFLVLSVLITRSVREPIIELIDRLRHVAEGDGDLTVTLDEGRRDEAGSAAVAFNKFLAVLVDTIGKVNNTADELERSSEGALNAMQKTLHNVEMQREDIQQVSDSIHSMYASTQEVAGSSADASSVTNEVRERVLDGHSEAKATLGEIQNLSDEVERSSAVIENLVSETNNIGKVLESIQGIAEQTNLLALNAAIEAARAGDSGRGFAVVADEVRMLAQRTQDATVDIQQLVERLQKEAQNAVASMNRGTKTAEGCLIRSSSSARTFEIAADSVTQIASLNEQIAQSARTQSQVASELNKTLRSIHAMAEETATETRNTAAASETIAKNVISLHKSLNKFQV